MLLSTFYMLRMLLKHTFCTPLFQSLHTGFDLHTGFCIQAPAYRLLHTGFGIQASAYRLLHTGFGIQASAYRLRQTDSVQQAQYKKLNCSGQADAQQEIPTCFDSSSSCLFWMIARWKCYIR